MADELSVGKYRLSIYIWNPLLQAAKKHKSNECKRPKKVSLFSEFKTKKMFTVAANDLILADHLLLLEELL